MMCDTIAQIATAPYTGAVAIIKISGNKALEIANKLFVRVTDGKEIPLNSPKSHRLYYGIIKDGANTADEVLLSYMRAPNSYTKEDVVEINCHGGQYTTRRILSLITDSGARLAEPGEFTKRAFINGRIDLSQAEAIADLIASQTRLESRVSLSHLSGFLKKSVTQYRETLLDLTARIEASLDYPEDDLEHENLSFAKDTCCYLLEQIGALTADTSTGLIIKNGIQTAIAGRPNVGKSSLFNALLNEERAIVTSKPGTTRDTITEQIDIGDLCLCIADTAGIREASDEAEAEGVLRAQNVIQSAQLTLFVVDGSSDISSDDIRLLDTLDINKTIILVNKCDLEQKTDISVFIEKGFKGRVLNVSAKKRIGLHELYEMIKELFVIKGIGDKAEYMTFKQRHIQSLKNASLSLHAALETINSGHSEDLLAADLLDAYNALGEITGETTDDDVINRIFADFCLGK